MSHEVNTGDLVRLKWTHEIANLGGRLARTEAKLKYSSAMRNTPMIVISKTGTGRTASIECLSPTGAVLNLKVAGVTKRGPWNR